MAPKKLNEYKTYLSEQLAKDSYNVYFKIDNHYPVESFEWLRVYRGSSILSTVSQAYQQGQKIQIGIGAPYKALYGKQTATIKSARIVW